MPALLFTTLMKVQVNVGDVGRVALFLAIILLGMASIGWLYSRIFHLDKATTSSAVISTTLFNAVHLGFPLTLFFFGHEGLEYAVILVALNTIPHHGFGLFVAVQGALSNRDALLTLLRMPTFIVIGIAVILRVSDVSVPGVIFEPLAILGKAGIPLVLVFVGMELGRLRLGKVGKITWGVIGIRLLFAPVLAWGAAELVGLSGLLRSVVIIIASMPTAIMPISFAREFGSNVAFVSRAVFYSTILSIITIPVLCILIR